MSQNHSLPTERHGIILDYCEGCGGSAWRSVSDGVAVIKDTAVRQPNINHPASHVQSREASIEQMQPQSPDAQANLLQNSPGYFADSSPPALLPQVPRAAVQGLQSHPYQPVDQFEVANPEQVALAPVQAQYFVNVDVLQASLPWSPKFNKPVLTFLLYGCLFAAIFTGGWFSGKHSKCGAS